MEYLNPSSSRIFASCSGNCGEDFSRARIRCKESGDAETGDCAFWVGEEPLHTKGWSGRRSADLGDERETDVETIVG